MQHLQNLKVGDSVLTRVRMVFKHASTREGRKIQLEIRERLRGSTLLGLLNQGDERFANSNTRPAWIVAEIDQFFALFGSQIDDETKSKITALDVSTGMSYSEMVEDTHYVNVDILNPTVELDGKAQTFRVQVNESTTPFYEGQPPKKNPSTDVVFTHKGENIYASTSVVLGEPNHVYLEADPISATKPAGMSTAEVSAHIDNVVGDKVLK